MVPVINTFHSCLHSFRADTRGEAYLDVAMKILMTVVIGAAVLLVLNNTIPDLFRALIQKVSSVLDAFIISVTPNV